MTIKPFEFSGFLRGGAIKWKKEYKNSLGVNKCGNKKKLAESERRIAASQETAGEF